MRISLNKREISRERELSKSKKEYISKTIKVALVGLYLQMNKTITKESNSKVIKMNKGKKMNTGSGVFKFAYNSKNKVYDMRKPESISKDVINKVGFTHNRTQNQTTNDFIDNLKINSKNKTCRPYIETTKYATENKSINISVYDSERSVL